MALYRKRYREAIKSRSKLTFLLFESREYGHSELTR
jgi:hypothetical protein